MKVSPMMPTSVLALVAAAARTSAKRAVSDAFRPKAVRLSVTMSLTWARSSPDARARSTTPVIPDSISCAFQPAIAI